MSGVFIRKRAKFIIGQCIYHRWFDCRGVIMGVDPVIMEIAAWYDRGARSHPPKDQSRYHILVHDEDNETCVADRNLIEDNTRGPVHHSMQGDPFVDLDRVICHTGRQKN